MLVLPAGARRDLLDALPQPDGADPKAVHRDRVGLHHLLEPQLHRVQAELVGDLVELHLHGETGLRGAVAALGAAGRLVGEHPHALELVRRQIVGHRLQRSGVVDRGQAVAAVAAAVEEGAEPHAGEGAVALDPGAHPHLHRVASPVHVERLLAVEGDLYRPAGDHRQLGHRDLVGEGVALAAEAAAHRRGDDPDVSHGKVQHPGEGAMHVVGRLGRGPQRQLPVRGVGRQRTVLLHGQVGVALEEVGALEDLVRLLKTGLHLAELEGDRLLDVGAPVPGMDAVVLGLQRALDGKDGIEHLVVDVDEAQGLLRHVLADGRHRRHRVADVADLVHRQRFLVLGGGHDAELRRHVVAGDDGVDPRKLQRPAGGDAVDQRVGMRAPQQPGEQHARHDDVVRVAGVARALGRTVDTRQRLADNREPVLLPVCTHGCDPFISVTARSTDSMILV